MEDCFLDDLEYDKKMTEIQFQNFKQSLHTVSNFVTLKLGYRNGMFEGKSRSAQATLDKIYPLMSSLGFFLGFLDGLCKGNSIALESDNSVCDFQKVYAQITEIIDSIVEENIENISDNEISSFSSNLTNIRIDLFEKDQQVIDFVFSDRFTKVYEILIKLSKQVKSLIF